MRAGSLITSPSSLSKRSGASLPWSDGKGAPEKGRWWARKKEKRKVSVPSAPSRALWVTLFVSGDGNARL